MCDKNSLVGGFPISIQSNQTVCPACQLEYQIPCQPLITQIIETQQIQAPHHQENKASTNYFQTFRMTQQLKDYITVNQCIIQLRCCQFQASKKVFTSHFPDFCQINLNHSPTRKYIKQEQQKRIDFPIDFKLDEFQFNSENTLQIQIDKDEIDGCFYYFGLFVVKYYSAEQILASISQDQSAIKNFKECYDSIKRPKQEEDCDEMQSIQLAHSQEEILKFLLRVNINQVIIMYLT
ncbi:UNKNOWN [Stylonychia lemnae]|uniref:Uncharacterized protein n=1 Tax=Stylonychia lemnae TaxID=5949 RepID=A0A078ALT2_STYLE|nr:UNKNOWN [Stylonychia lemnae]|eukprot:CDW82836.1 UNKNOWN [Stylonychia lemnae]